MTEASCLAGFKVFFAAVISLEGKWSYNQPPQYHNCLGHWTAFKPPDCIMYWFWHPPHTCLWKTSVDLEGNVCTCILQLCDADRLPFTSSPFLSQPSRLICWQKWVHWLLISSPDLFVGLNFYPPAPLEHFNDPVLGFQLALNGMPVPQVFQGSGKAG